MNKSQTHPRQDALQEVIARMIALAGLGSVDGQPRRPHYGWGKEGFSANVLRLIPSAAEERCRNLAADILAALPQTSLQEEIEDIGESLRVISSMAVCEDGETAEERERIVDGCREVSKLGLQKLDKLLSASPEQRPAPPPEAVAWLPIETAPKDTWFIAHQNGETYPCEWATKDDGEGGITEGWFDHFNQSFEEPSSWHPVPDLAAPPPEAVEFQWETVDGWTSISHGTAEERRDYANQMARQFGGRYRELYAAPPPEADEALRKAAVMLNKMREGIIADVLSAHQNRGNGASEWMREDDREFRTDLRTAFDALDAALAALPAPSQPEVLQNWREEITHPNNRLLFKAMVAKAGIDLEADDIATGLAKVAALPAPSQQDGSECCGQIRWGGVMCEACPHRASPSLSPTQDRETVIEECARFIEEWAEENSLSGFQHRRYERLVRAIRALSHKEAQGEAS